VADLAYSYIVVVKRIRANEAEDPKTITVTHDNRAPAATKKFELTIAPSELAGAGRCAYAAGHPVCRAISAYVCIALSAAWLHM